MNRTLSLYAAFAVCLIVLFGALGWASLRLVRSEREQHEARIEAEARDRVRLALWRMDSALAGMLAEENVRSVGDWRTLAGASPSGKVPAGDVAAQASVKRSYFHFEAPGSKGAPATPVEGPYDASELARLIALAPPVALPAAAIVSPTSDLANGPPTVRTDFSRRAEIATANTTQVQGFNGMATLSELLDRAGPTTGTWRNGQLLLVRRAVLQGCNVLQGCELDLGGLKVWLKDQVVDLLPEATLHEPTTADLSDPERLLSALPLRIDSGSLPADAVPPPTSPAAPLAVAWLAAAAAAVAVGLGLRGVIALSERRAAFVSAVTHELRTPLTTFRLYSEMLAAGMVTDDLRRRQYYQTLQAEADRLEHMVENVLAYARLERGRLESRFEVATLGALVDRALPRLETRVAASHARLEVDRNDASWSTAARVDPAAVEIVLFNLVDNACKYAVGKANGERTIRLEPNGANGYAGLCVCDQGPGIDSRLAKKLFRPFHRSAEEAAGGSPGVGLGLSLCRRMLRQGGGNLTYRPLAGGGACFEVQLRRTANEQAET